MIKKHIITCTIILALLVMAKVFAYNMPRAKKSLIKKENTALQHTITKKTEGSKLLIARLNFAEDTLPPDDVRIKKKMKKFLSAYSYSHLQTNRLHRKAAEWFPVIEPILAAYGIPDDFKYVPLVESGLHEGVSSKGAAGFWQFMPQTARMYGLKVNDQVDERKNLRKSTIAACKYIKELYRIFDNWTLAAAAYNLGDTRLQKQINKQDQDNYYKMRLNRETGSYVYKLISMKEIVEDPVRYGYIVPKALLAMNEE